MFADTMNSWELGLAPTPLSYAKANLGQDEDAFYDIEGSQGNDNAPLLDSFESFDAPLDLDIFEQELKKHEVSAVGTDDDIKPVANSTFIDDAFDNKLAVIADPKMLTAAAASTEDDSGLGSMMLVDESTGIDVEDTQNLIDEMESFLKQHETTSHASALEAKPIFSEVIPNQGLDLLEQVMEEVDRMPLKDEMSASQPAALSAEDSEQAEAILDALIKGDLTTDYESSIHNATVEIVEETATTITQREVFVPKPKKPVFCGINNISEVVTADGQKIVIVIANDVPGAAQNIKAQVAATLPNPAKTYQQQETITTVVSEAEEDETSSDSDWSPYSPVATHKKTTTSVGSRPSATKGVSVGRVAKQRGPYSKRAHASIKDKKERKKLQNVEAARRYRDKKKAEQTVIESEEDILERKNKTLKGKLSEMENELKTLKKLMTELGLVK